MQHERQQGYSAAQAIELAEVLNVLVKNVQEAADAGCERPSGMALEEVGGNRKNMTEAFKESLIWMLFNEADEKVKTSKFKNFTKIHIHADIGMTKLELTVGTLNMTSIAINSLQMTYDAVLNVNFFYNPDVSRAVPVVLRDL